MRDYDVAIAGGGPAGMTLALALAGTGRRIALVESAPVRAPGASGDSRGLALSPATVRVLEALGLWDRIRSRAAPIRRIHVSEEGCFGCVRFDAATLGRAWLGQVVPAEELAGLLAAEVAGRDAIEILRPARAVRAAAAAAEVTLDVETGSSVLGLRCRLLVVADGARSALREALGMEAAVHDYGQTAIVATVTPARAHADTARERFSTFGPTALLPLTDGRCTAVLCVPSTQADAVLALSDREYLNLLDARSGRRLGGFRAAGPRGRWPLVRSLAPVQVRGRALLLGNAAHTLHPNAAQGLNLVLRDIAELAGVLRDAPDPGAADLLAAYVDARRADQAFVGGFTHGLAQLFYTERCGPRLLRRAGMLLTERLPALKRALVFRAAGLAGRQPAWVRGVQP